ncbi:TPA: 2Fe-2S iron-sulfur cluster binding domain-containing protein [Burkholderia aenigmatica]|uniref:2Fe-2S iron-sulfur cluster binding domain-containing protein n=1 Tax=Burkholderia sp. AU45251 TaxID=3059204 RepID=UPI0026565900|nr:2Fe-2S iron-sulfur cluster binding domain-containing protein [Burkholderia sp. AU45251]HDR9482048.1 2Fe-2S iron-sulfur cluster binding domain-containing protein [Burkholderia aenigmatica]MDN7515319.1 2Fe-2S iron-sulfur cluster binding domain-containing protein [Burkholderia sp. AU45251]HDR9515515.1 2Fe-2S iron-sulfur cluster binding domain-containing protein [Burkholderia aenigmatica]HDR9590419.1 2Fe-2S iron-sulfur cluster binding domain-containing protein [Burkholderia aenigmatica]HDR95987
MLSFLTKPKTVTAVVNDRAIAVQPGETLLQAALRQGIDFPHSCRVGGCATCKCRLIDGRVKELTQTGYILSDDDLDQGFILACQSIPRTDVTVAVDMSRDGARRTVGGRVIGQDRLTHDILRLRIQLDESLPYKAGQHARLSLASLPGEARSYSFATGVRPDAQAVFFVRKVPGGVFSGHVHEQDVVGKTVTVEGPLGDFWMRAAAAPLILIAGGSGLAPVLSLLEDGAAARVARPVTLLFGARAQRDLYALDTISDLARRWHDRFDFLPILSEEPLDSSWRGARGLVTNGIADDLPADAHAYLCGPPPMIDAATGALLARGLSHAHIHADRFTTQHDTQAIS